MTPPFDSNQKRTIQEVLEWHEFQTEVLGREKTARWRNYRRRPSPFRRIPGSLE